MNHFVVSAFFFAPLALFAVNPFGGLRVSLEPLNCR
jgi:hypothetical protein